MPIKFDVLNRWTQKVQFTAEINCDETVEYSVKLGLAVKWGVETRANLAGANLTGAYLTGANLTGAYLMDANLMGANLTGAYLTGANLTGANLTGANLAGAYLTGANLTGANLMDANLAGAYLGGADLGGAYLAVADLIDAKNAELAIARTRILPEGTLIGWKKLERGVIAKLEIPAEARRSHAFGRKCRAEYVKCLEVIGAEFGVSMHDETTQYRAGEIIKPHLFDENWQEECAGGIHFYITREEAEAHS